MDSSHECYEQKISYARASLWAPFYAVGMTARIQGEVPTDLLTNALHKLQILHPPLASRVRVERDGAAWLTTAGVGAFPLEVRPKVSDDDWAGLLLEQERAPFPFERGPLTRFYLLRGAASSDLIVVAPHVVCDGYSMAHVMCDAVALLNDPEREVLRPPLPPAVTWQTMPHALSDNLLLRGLVRAANGVWRGPRVTLRQQEYQELHRQYWARHHNGLLALALSPAETSDLAARCRQHGVAITGALVAAFLLARNDVWPAGQPAPREISVATNIRDRMTPHPGCAVGVYASSLDVRIRAQAGDTFWALASAGHRRIHRALDDRAQVLKPLVLTELDPRIIDAAVAALATGEWGREFALFTRFVKIKETVRSLNVSNIGRIELPDLGAPYRLETLLPFPPVVPGGELALNALTVRGQMHVLLRFRQDRVDAALVARLKERALHYLFGAP
jgi:hypothetical protein